MLPVPACILGDGRHFSQVVGTWGAHGPRYRPPVQFVFWHSTPHRRSLLFLRGEQANPNQNRASFNSWVRGVWPELRSYSRWISPRPDGAKPFSPPLDLLSPTPQPATRPLSRDSGLWDITTNTVNTSPHPFWILDSIPNLALLFYFHAPSFILTVLLTASVPLVRGWLGSWYWDPGASPVSSPLSLVRSRTSRSQLPLIKWFIRGRSGSLNLTFPSFSFKSFPAT